MIKAVTNRDISLIKQSYYGKKTGTFQSFFRRMAQFAPPPNTFKLKGRGYLSQYIK